MEDEEADGRSSVGCQRCPVRQRFCAKHGAAMTVKLDRPRMKSTTFCAHHACGPTLHRCLQEEDVCKVALSCHFAVDVFSMCEA